MTEKEIMLDKEIVKDRMKYFAEDSLFLQENLKAKDIGEEKENDGKISSEEGKDSSKKQFGDVSDLSKHALKKSKNVIHKMKAYKARANEDELVHGYGNSIHSLIKLGVKGGIFAVLLGPILGAIGFVTAGMLKKGTKLANRKRLYESFKGDLAVLESRIEDLNSKQRLSPKEREEKYALIKVKNELEGKMHSLKRQIMYGE